MLTKLRLVRLQKGLTQAAVVELTRGRIPQYRLSLLERGVSPKPEEVTILAQAFDLQSTDLFPVSTQFMEVS
jgi:transcriptional regulator with XRE-family HTH domain